MAFPWPGLDGDDPSHLKAALKYSPISGCDLQGQGQELFVCPYIISWERADRLSGCWDHTRSCRGSAEVVGGSGRCLGGALQKKKKAKGLAGTVPVSSPPGTGGGPRSGVSPLLWHSRGAGSSRCITHPRWWAKDRGKITSHPISFGFGVFFFSPFPLALELCAEPRLFKVGFVLFF